MSLFLSPLQWSYARASLKAHPKAIDAFIIGNPVKVEGFLVDSHHVGFDPKSNYTIPRPTQEINGVTLEAPLTPEEAKERKLSIYFFESPSDEDYSRAYTFYALNPDEVDQRLFSLGICYSTQEAAAAACKARYNITR